MSIRRAVPTDAEELTRLRQVMLESVGHEPDDAWWAACVTAFEEGLADERFVGFVADSPHGGLAACGVAMQAVRLPGPGNHSGRMGYIQSMCTDERHRRQGLARVVFGELMAWFEAEGITAVDLHATEVGEPLYRSFGFADPGHPELRWRA